MNDKLKNLELKLKKVKQSFKFVSKSIELALSMKEGLSNSAKHYLFQYQVLLESNWHLLEKYEYRINKLKEKEITTKEYEHISRVLNNLIADHQAKAISIDNILEDYK
ncbi:MAG: hypothetical protein A3B68_00325 [Candidatus Melainabacteria bacterium RIFCSPHIGHO2_02_FULL_34_12]|nr:MAG: hypothetical protein A3B68_00325 [Candidatus Melainabacteria bacterium RIFCSPHIGHO2_02_FULL_34_12]